QHPPRGEQHSRLPGEAGHDDAAWVGSIIPETATRASHKGRRLWRMGFIIGPFGPHDTALWHGMIVVPASESRPIPLLRRWPVLGSALFQWITTRSRRFRKPGSRSPARTLALVSCAPQSLASWESAMPNTSSVVRSVILFILAGVCEIGGGWLVWKWL